MAHHGRHRHHGHAHHRHGGKAVQWLLIIVLCVFVITRPLSAARLAVRTVMFMVGLVDKLSR